MSNTSSTIDPPDKNRSPKQRVSIALVMPGPKNGMTLMTERIVDAIGRRYAVRLDDLGRGYRGPGRRWQIRKALQSLVAAVRIATWSRTPGEHLYLTVNSHGGLIYNLWHVAAARLRGFRPVLHHHCWSYLHQYDRKMQWLIRLAGADAVHAIACPEMLDRLRTLYNAPFQHAFMTPGIIGYRPSDLADDRGNDVGDDDSTFCIGMLSNLTREKGTIDAIECFEELRRRGVAVRLRLAGPIRDAATEQRIAEATTRHGDAVQYVGPVYDDDKLDFYRSLDAFIFPTRYPNESWGIVLNEALMTGLPVLTYRRGCTGYVVGRDGGIVIERDRDFATIAADQIERWCNDSDAYQHAVDTARRRGNALYEEAERQLDRFIDGFASGNFPDIKQASFDSTEVVDSGGSAG